MIHPTAIINSTASLDEKEVEIGPFCVVGPEVVIGPGTVLGPHVIVEKWTRIGSNCRIGAGAFLGGDPQDLGYKGEPTRLVIGDRNIIREYATIHRGTVEGVGVTTVGDDNYIMAYCHFGHDCRVGNNNIFTNYTGLSGHVEVENETVFSAYSAVHQFTRVGRLAMISSHSQVKRDVPPFITVDQRPAVPRGLNTVGMRRRGISSEVRADIKRAYRFLYRSGLNTAQALDRIRTEIPSGEEIRHFVRFVEESKRGICRESRRHSHDEENDD